MELRQLLRNKLKLSTVIGFLRYWRKEMSMVIFAVAIFYGAFLLYNYAFKPIWFPEETLEVRARLNQSLYEKIWRDFSERSVRLRNGVDKKYSDPFR